jgi:hypothetical protein
VIKKRGRMKRGFIVLGSTGGTIAQLTSGLWHSESHKRWLIPLAIFLCLTGLILIVATTVEALAPFIYSIW